MEVVDYHWPGGSLSFQLLRPGQTGTDVLCPHQEVGWTGLSSH